MTHFACGECWPSPRAGCMYENHSTAFPDAKMKDLGCPRGRKPNWKYIDRAEMRAINPRLATVGQLIHCYSQRDLEAGLTIEQFYEKQGRVYQSGDWIHPSHTEFTNKVDPDGM